MNRFTFWQKWLFAVSVLISIFGLALALFNQTLLFDILFNNQINPSFWNAKVVTDDVAAFQQWVYGVLGATVAGWGIFMAFIAHYPFENREKWAWNCLAAGLTVWFVADTAISLYFAPFNAAFNTGLFILVVLPLVFTRKHFR